VRRPKSAGCAVIRADFKLRENLVGGYTGEMVIRAYGGQWVIDVRGRERSLVQIQHGPRFFENLSLARSRTGSQSSGGSGGLLAAEDRVHGGGARLERAPAGKLQAIRPARRFVKGQRVMGWREALNELNTADIRSLL